MVTQIFNARAGHYAVSLCIYLVFVFFVQLTFCTVDAAFFSWQRGNHET